MACPGGAARPAPAAPGAARCGNYTPAHVFRERLLQLANEYELMQASLARLREEGGDALPRRSDGSSMCEEHTPWDCVEGLSWDTPQEEGRAKPLCSARGVRFQQPEVGAKESPSDASFPELDLPRPPDLEASAGPTESEQVTVQPDMSGTPSSSPSNAPGRGLRRQRKRSLIRAQKPKHDWRSRPLSWLAHSTYFERFIGFTIVLNVAFLGVSTEIAISDARSGDAGKTHVSLQAIEVGFLTIYALELIIRVVVFGRPYFTDENDRFWNLFDMALVIQSLIEQVSEGAAAGNLSFLRGLRLLKTLKMLRVVRLMRSMRELRMILFAVLGSLKSMAWSLMLLVTVLYMFALILLQGLVLYLEAPGDSINDAVSEGIVAYWGAVHTSMLTLFMSSSGGMDWESAFDVLVHAGVFFQAVFLIYMSFFMFVITNAITSIFVEATFERATRDLFGRIQTELDKKQEYEKNLHVLFEEMDECKTGELSLEELERQVKDPKMLGFLASMDLTIRDASGFFSVLSENGTKAVDTQQFVTSCTRMHGPAQVVDVREILARQSEMHETICEFRRAVEAQLAATSYGQREEHWNAPVAVPSAMAMRMDTGAESASSMQATKHFLMV